MERFISLAYEDYSSLEELSSAEEQTVEAAVKASERSYSPYSGFRVGAAAVLDNGEIICASNQESEVLPSGICAERALLYYYQANCAEKKIKAMAIFSPDSSDISPCGACRQVMLDTEKRQGKPFTVILASNNGGKIVRTAASLLPFCFSLPKK